MLLLAKMLFDWLLANRLLLLLVAKILEVLLLVLFPMGLAKMFGLPVPAVLLANRFGVEPWLAKRLVLEVLRFCHELLLLPVVLGLVF